MAKLTECVKNIKDWMTNNFLLLNSDKTEILLIGPKNSTQNFLDHNLQLDGCPVLSSSVINLGVILRKLFRIVYRSKSNFKGTLNVCTVEVTIAGSAKC